MEELSIRKVSEKNKEKAKVVNKKKYEEEKKIKSDITSNVTHGIMDSDVENIVIVGKSCNLLPCKIPDTTFNLHECRSETAIGQVTEPPKLPEDIHCEGSALPFTSLSCASFISAQSDVSNSKTSLMEMQDLDHDLHKNDTEVMLPEKSSNKLGSSLQLNVQSETDYIAKLKEMEKKIVMKEKKIKDLNKKLEDSNSLKSKKIKENRDLTHQINVLNRQLQSLYELMGQKSLTKTINPIELLQWKNKATELQSVIEKLEEDNKKLKENVTTTSENLSVKEKELSSKNKELMDYKNRSTLEMCKLINKIDSLKRSMKVQSEECENKITEAQNSMDDELVKITAKLEDQYQNDLKSAIEKMHSQFERFAILPTHTIEKFLEVCESGNIDWLSIENEDFKKNELSNVNDRFNEEINNLRNSYEKKIKNLKDQLEFISEELKEKNKMLEIFESEVQVNHENSCLKLLRSSNFVEDFTSLQDLYKVELNAQYNVHKIETNVFEEKVKALSSEILFRAKNEENNLLELENAKKVAQMYREKYENFVLEWGDRLQEKCESLVTSNFVQLDLDDIFEHMKNLIDALHRAEIMYEKKVQKMSELHENEVIAYKDNIEIFKNKLTEMEIFQRDQSVLDETIQELIENVGTNYIKTVEALVTSHTTELSLKQLEMYTTEKKYIDEITSLKTLHQKEVEELEKKLLKLEEWKSKCPSPVDIEEMSLKLLKYEGMMALKEETENALINRISELENLYAEQKESWQRQAETLMGKLVESNVVASAKDDLVKELEDKLNVSEKLIKKSYKNEENIYGICLLEKNVINICQEFPESNETDITLNDFYMMKNNCEQLRAELAKTFDTIESLKREIEILKNNEKDSKLQFLESTKTLEDSINILTREKIDFSIKIKAVQTEKDSMLQKLKTKEEAIEKLEEEIINLTKTNQSLMRNQVDLKNQLEIFNSEKQESIRILSEEKEAALKRNNVLEQELNDLKNEKNEKKSDSGSNEKVQVLYQEEGSESTSSASCQVNLIPPDLQKESLTKETGTLFTRIDVGELVENEREEFSNNNGDIILGLKKELSEAMKERNEWIVVSRNLEREKKNLKEKLKNLRQENLKIKTKFDAHMKILEPKQSMDQTLIEEAKWDKGKALALNNHEKVRDATYVDKKTASHDLESREQLKHNQNLTSELEEAWAQRYEVEDQLTKVRRENALLNIHRSQLEDTNRRISNLITESKPSVASWMKIHETVENIVDEVLALKTSFAEMEPLPKAGTSPDTRKTHSELLLMSETLHAQIQNKTVLCDELLIQKKTLECELRDLEELLKENDSRILNKKRLTGGRRPSADYFSKYSRFHRFEIDESRQNEMSTFKIYGESQYNTLTLLKSQMESQAGLEEAQFRKNLEREIQGLKKEVQQLEMNIALKKKSLEEINTEEERDWTLIEISYEEEVLGLMKEFEIEVQKLRSAFSDENIVTAEWEEEAREKYILEIDKIREYFEKRHEDLEKKYYEVYNTLDKNRLNSALEKERQRVINCFQKILQTKEGKIQETELENFLNDTVNKYIEEIKCLRNKYKKNLIEHASEIESLRSVITRLKENALCEEETRSKEDSSLEIARLEFEHKLQKEREQFKDVINKLKEKHEKDMLEKEKYWASKICKCQELESDCPDDLKLKEKEMSSTSIENKKTLADSVKMQNTGLDLSTSVKGNGHEIETSFRLDEKPLETNANFSLLSRNSYFSGDEVKTDDDKMDIIRERDSLKEMVFSLRTLLNKLLNFMTQPEKESSDDTLKDFSGEDTLYKSVLISTDDHQANDSIISQNWTPRQELSTIIQEIHNHSLLNSSEHILFDLNKCLNKIKKDAVGLLTLSSFEGGRHLAEIVAKVEEEKNNLREKVEIMEKTQTEIREEIESTKEKLANWERHLEVVSEGYGEEVIEPKKITASVDHREKLRMFFTESACISSDRETAFLEEIYKEGCIREEEWKKEKLDLQQQIDVADKQLHSLRKFMEEQAAERELERDAFDKEINRLKENLKHKERDNVIHNRNSQEIEALESQMKELISQMDNLERNKNSIELEFQTAVKKIWTLREVIQDLEAQLADCNERESQQKKKIEKLDNLMKELANTNSNLKEELEMCKTQNAVKTDDHIKSLENECLSLQRLVDQINTEDLIQMKSTLKQIESLVVKKTKDLEQLHISSTNVSCSSPSEDVSIRDRFDATRCSTPDEMTDQRQNLILPLQEVDRLQEKISRHTRAEEVALKYINDLKMQLSSYKKSCEELLTERDVLLEKVDLYLKENSGLKTRLEEQRCNASLLQKKLNADLESQIQRLESDWERLNELCIQKDKQLHDMEKMLENTTKALNLREAEVLTKQKEENSLITTLKLDLANALNEKEVLENDLEKVKEKLKNSFKIPALIDSVIEEKNAEIDRLEKEVSRLSSEKSSLEMASKNYQESNIEKSGRRIKFSEPESFEDCLSTISPYKPSVIRNCSDSFMDFKSMSFKARQYLHHSKELESVSSIGPLQLSPRGLDMKSNWKTSSPLIAAGDSIENKSNFNVPKDESKLLSDLASKEAEVSNLQVQLNNFKRQLDEMGQELEASKNKKTELQKNLEVKEEEISRLRDIEKNLITSLESLNKKHLEEMNELNNKLSFERGKVEKVYNEIKTLEGKKNEIEEAFYSLKEEYNGKSDREHKMTKVLVERIKELESRNVDLEKNLTIVKEETERVIKEANSTMQVLYKELTDVKEENEELKKKPVSLSNAEVQVDTLQIETLMKDLVNWTVVEVGSKSLRENLNELKSKLNGIGEMLIKESNTSEKDITAYLVGLKNLMSFIIENMKDLLKEPPKKSPAKKSIDSSVDELAIKVQKELMLSEKLDNQLLQSIEEKNLKRENTFAADISIPEGDVNQQISKTKQESNETIIKALAMHQLKAENLKKENEELTVKVENHEKIIGFLEANLVAEKQRIIAEKERCKEDARIMELLRVKLEKGLDEIKSKDRDLKKERQLRQTFEREIETLKKRLANVPENKEGTQDEKLSVLSQNLESERKKGKELKLLLEKEKLERMSEKEAQKLWENDFNLLKEQKDTLKCDLLKTKQLLHSREKEINLLKRKINLQEIDLKALSLSNEFAQESAALMKAEEFGNAGSSTYGDGFSFSSPTGSNSQSLLLKMKKLNSCVQHHVEESNNAGESFLQLNEEIKQGKDLLKKLEQLGDAELKDDTLLAEGEVERKLWDLERGKLLMDVESLRTENDIIKRDSIETYKKNEFLQLENSKLKAEIKLLEKETTSQIELGMLRDRMSNLLRKYLRTESYRKALVWQKQYLTVTLNGYRTTEEDLMRKMGRRNRKKETKGKGVAKFRIVALAITSVFRMKFIVKRWQKPKTGCLFDPLPNVAKQNLPETIVNRAWSDPFNPLTYRSQNLFRRPSTRVLRTPPSRDPGLHSFTPERKVSEGMEGFTSLEGTPATVQ